MRQAKAYDLTVSGIHYPKRLHGLSDVMHPHDSRPRARAACQGTLHPEVHGRRRLTGQLTDHRFPDNRRHGNPQHQFVSAAARPGVFEGFAEAKPGSSISECARQARGDTRLNPLREEGQHLAHHVLVLGRPLHGRGRPLHVHETYRHAGGGRG